MPDNIKQKEIYRNLNNFSGAIQRVETGGCVVSHSIDVKEMKLGPILPLSVTHKRPMSVGYSIFPIPNHAWAPMNELNTEFHS